MNRSSFLPVLLLVAALAPMAPADVVIVVPSPEITSIQQGVDAAGPGDTVLVTSGVYTETVLVPAEKAGLVIQGKGNVIVDARPLGRIGSGPAFTVQAADVTLARLVIRHAKPGEAVGDSVPPGVGVLAQQADGLTLDRVTVLDCDEGGLLAEGSHGVTVTRCAFVANSGSIEIAGNDATISRSSFRCDSAAAVRVQGARTVVERCRFLDLADHAIVVDDLETPPSPAGLDAPANRLERNTIESAYAGISISGRSFAVARNRLADLGVGGGIVSHRGQQVLLDGNRIDHVLGTAILVRESDQVVLQRNRALYAGLVPDDLASDDPGLLMRGCMAAFFVEDSFHVVLERNVAQSGVSGFFVQAEVCDLIANLAVKNLRDGFVMQGFDLFLTGNQAIANFGEGFEIGPFHEQVEFAGKNKSKANRCNLAIDGPPNELSFDPTDDFGPGMTNPMDALPGEI